MTDLDDDVLAAWRGFLTAHAHLTRRISAQLTAAELPDLGWYDLLWALYSSPDRALRVNELAREVVLSATAMSRFVDRVEAAGYVERRPDPKDRRALQVAITPQGVDLLREMWPVYRDAIATHFAPHLRRPAEVRAMFERMSAGTRP